MAKTRPNFIVRLLNERPNGPLRVLLADDHEIIRLGVASALEDQLGCEICAQAGDGRQALKLVESTHPDVAVVDLGLPGLNGLDLTEQIRRFYKQTEVVIISGDDSADSARRALESGARAFVLKVDAVQHLAGAVQAAAQHRHYLTSHSHRVLQEVKVGGTVKPAPRKTKSLTSRERDVLQLLAEGKSNKEAAAILGLSVKTVKTHRAATMRKLKLNRASQLIRYAIRSKIIQA